MIALSLCRKAIIRTGIQERQSYNLLFLELALCMQTFSCLRVTHVKNHVFVTLLQGKPFTRLELITINNVTVDSEQVRTLLTIVSLSYFVFVFVLVASTLRDWFSLGAVIYSFYSLKTTSFLFMLVYPIQPWKHVIKRGRVQRLVSARLLTAPGDDSGVKKAGPFTKLGAACVMQHCD